MISDIGVAVDTELDGDTLLEVGLATFNWRTKEILGSYSLPISPEAGAVEVRPEIQALTGWTLARLRKQGFPAAEVTRRMQELYGMSNRLLVTDSGDEIPFLERTLGATFSSRQLNVSLLFALTQKQKGRNPSLEEMLTARGLTFQGTPHRAAEDALNIARLFLSFQFAGERLA